MPASAELQVDPRISPSDGMFEGNERHYFSVGRSALLNIKRALDAAGDDPPQPARILDFPCGHGRVLRYLRAAFPQAEITACDLSRDGVDFCASIFGAIPVYSDVDPARIKLPRNAFDLIWVGSLFTHFDASEWKSFLGLFRDLLNSNGVVVFSTQGRYAHSQLVTNVSLYDLGLTRRGRLLEDFESSGFGYVDYAGSPSYGISLAEPAWVCRMITSVRDLRLIHVIEKSWDNHHDVYACMRDVAWTAACTHAPDPQMFKDPSVPLVCAEGRFSPGSGGGTGRLEKMAVRHRLAVEPERASTGVVVGQAFQPDAPKCQAGKPDLRKTVAEQCLGWLECPTRRVVR